MVAHVRPKKNSYEDYGGIKWSIDIKIDFLYLLEILIKLCCCCCCCILFCFWDIFISFIFYLGRKVGGYRM